MPSLRLDGHVYCWVLAVFLVLVRAGAPPGGLAVGLALRGIRDNESRMRAFGYPTTGYALGRLLRRRRAGRHGGLALVTVQRFVSPGDAGFEVAALALLAVIIGGVARWGAPASGAALVIVTRD